MPIDGQWFNALGSVLQITSNGTSITGTYQVVRGNSQTIYPLVGSITGAGTAAVGWTILWANANGDTNTLNSYAGIYVPGSPDSILTTWLRRTEVTEIENWAGTQIGVDVFGRTAP